MQRLLACIFLGLYDYIAYQEIVCFLCTGVNLTDDGTVKFFRGPQPLYWRVSV